MRNASVQCTGDGYRDEFSWWRRNDGGGLVGEINVKRCCTACDEVTEEEEGGRADGANE